MVEGPPFLVGSPLFVLFHSLEGLEGLKCHGFTTQSQALNGRTAQSWAFAAMPGAPTMCLHQKNMSQICSERHEKDQTGL